MLMTLLTLYWLVCLETGLHKALNSAKAAERRWLETSRWQMEKLC